MPITLYPAKTEEGLGSYGGATKKWVHDTASFSVLEQILVTLKKIEYHQMLASDTELKDEDVGG